MGALSSRAAIVVLHYNQIIQVTIKEKKEKTYTSNTKKNENGVKFSTEFI